MKNDVAVEHFIDFFKKHNFTAGDIVKVCDEISGKANILAMRTIDERYAMPISVLLQEEQEGVV